LRHFFVSILRNRDLQRGFLIEIQCFRLLGLLRHILNLISRSHNVSFVIFVENYLFLSIAPIETTCSKLCYFFFQLSIIRCNVHLIFLENFIFFIIFIDFDKDLTQSRTTLWCFTRNFFHVIFKFVDPGTNVLHLHCFDLVCGFMVEMLVAAYRHHHFVWVVVIALPPLLQIVEGVLLGVLDHRCRLFHHQTATSPFIV